MQYSVRASSQVHSAHPSLTQHNTFIGSTVWVTCITSTAPLRAPPPPSSLTLAACLLGWAPCSHYAA